LGLAIVDTILSAAFAHNRLRPFAYWIPL